MIHPIILIACKLYDVPFEELLNNKARHYAAMRQMTFFELHKWTNLDNAEIAGLLNKNRTLVNSSVTKVCGMLDVGDKHLLVYRLRDFDYLCEEWYHGEGVETNSIPQPV